jgi:hypothetical protein
MLKGAEVTTMWTISKKLVAGFVIIATSSSIALGQTTFGSLTGTITDPSGAVVPGVRVAITNLGTSSKQIATTNADGIYVLVNLLPGNYRIDAERAGFKRFSQQPVIIQVHQSYRIDIRMQVGAVTQTVHVTAATPLLQPQTSSLGQVVAGRSVTEMPLNGRNVFNLMELVPSVVPQGSALGTPTGVNPFGFNNYQVNGSFGGESVEYLDGTPLNNGYIHLPSLIPTQDSIEEFKVQTNNLGPEWGGFAGGVMNLSTKSGTNELHGEAYEYLRNAVLNANTFFNNEAGFPVGAFTQNQFGANAGGPLVIPHIYNGENKTFWFFSWEGFRLRQGYTFVDTVPTQAERGGDFSNLRDSNGNLIPIYNPSTVCGELGNANCSTAGGQPVYARQPFPGNVVPPSMIDLTSAKELFLWPLPNTTGAPFTNVNNFTSTSPVGGNNNEAVTRIDQNISAKQHFFARFSYWNNLDLPINPLGTGACVCTCTQTFSTKDVVIGDTYTISPDLLLDVHVGFDREAYNVLDVDRDFDLTSVGWPSLLNSEIPSFERVPPNPIVTGFASDVFGDGGLGFTDIDRTNTWFVSGDVTKISGKHTLKFGVQVMPMQFNYLQTCLASGEFDFTGSYSQEGPFNTVGGSPFVDYLLGYPASGTESYPALVAAQQISRAFYGGDTWQVSRKLTLDLGLRYELQGPWSERFDRLSLWNLSAPSPLAGPAHIPGLKGEVCLVVTPCDPSRNAWLLDERDFAPRVGLAYQITPNTVVRGGYGIFYVPFDAQWGLSPNNDFDNTTDTPFVSTINGGITPFQTWTTAFPNGVPLPPGRAPNINALAEDAGGPPEDVVENQPIGYMEQWNVDFQRQLPAGLFLDLAYAGSRGIHLFNYGQNVNQLPMKDLALGTALSTSVPNPFYGLIQSGPLSFTTTTKGQLLLPYPEFTSVSISNAGYGTSSYNALQVKLERHFRSGGMLLAAYTNEKLLTDTDSITSWLEAVTGGVASVPNWENIVGSAYSLASQDVPQRLVVSYVQNLPVGQGQKFGASIGGPVGKLISGWGVDGITTFQRGFPLKFTTAVNLTDSYGGGSVPNVIPGCKSVMPGSAESRLGQWFNTSCFAQPAPFTFGDEARVDPVLRMNGISNFDFAIFKNTTFGPSERFGLQFRTEFFNLFNSPQFGPPGEVLGTPQFGVVSSQVNNPRLVQFALKFMF